MTQAALEVPDITAARSPDGTEAELERIAALDDVAYDREREGVADQLGLRVGTLDAERAKRRPAAAAVEGQGRALELPNPEPWPVPVDGAALIAAIRDAVREYVILPPATAEAVALWVVHAHALAAFAISPRLAITSPEKRCGKTTLLDVLAKLVPRPLATANVGAAAFFRVIEAASPTLLIDEADTFLGEADDLRGILNSGHRRGGGVLRCIGDNHEPRHFATFGACVIAMIGRMHPTLEDRSVSVDMRRAMPGEKPRRFRPDRTPELDRLARMAARWAADNVASLREADPDMPEAIYNRAADNWRPLIAIADAAGGGWSERARDVAVAAVADQPEDGSRRTKLLADIRDAFAAAAVDRMASVALCGVLAAREDSPWAEVKAGKPITPIGLSNLLAPFKIAPRSIRLPSGETPKGYHLDSFAEVFGRYLPPVPPSSRNATAPQPNNDGVLTRSANATEASAWRFEKRDKPNNDGPCGVVAFPKGGGAGEGHEWGEI